MKYMPEANVKMDRRRIMDTMLTDMLSRLKVIDRLRSWAVNKRTKDSKNRVHPEANSPSLKNDLTFNEIKKQVRIPIKSNTSMNRAKVGVDENSPIPA